MKKSELEEVLKHTQEAFTDAANLIGAKKATFTLSPAHLSETLSRFNSKGEVTHEELMLIRETWKGDAPLVDGQGNPFVLYIPDFSGPYNPKWGAEGSSLPKYHFAWCSTLDSMTNNGRFKRYIKKDDIENLNFNGKDSNDRDTTKTLEACLNCEKRLIAQHARFPEYSRKNMDLILVFERYGFDTEARKPSESRPYSVKYPTSWAKISKRYRSSVNWICESCGTDFTKQANLLHTHHINGIKSDVRPSNLKALCHKCHSKEFGHSHMKRLLNGN